MTSHDFWPMVNVVNWIKLEYSHASTIPYIIVPFAVYNFIKLKNNWKIRIITIRIINRELKWKMLKLRMDISLRTDMKNQRQIISEKEAFRNIIEAIVQMGQFKISLNDTMDFLSSLLVKKVRTNGVRRALYQINQLIWPIRMLMVLIKWIS